MKCPRSQQDNPSHAKFCLECAAPVSAGGSPPRLASPEAYTPKHLAEKILTSQSLALISLTNFKNLDRS
jgi:hypothetical protein